MYSFLLLLLTGIPYIYLHLRRHLQRQKDIQMHEYVFSIFQYCACIYGSYILIRHNFFLEMIFGTTITLIIRFYFPDIFDHIIHNIDHEDTRKNMIILLIGPFLIFGIIRNIYDTYAIGMMIFNTSGIALLLWQIISLSLTNIVNKFESTNPLLIATIIIYLIIIIF